MKNAFILLLLLAHISLTAQTEKDSFLVKPYLQFASKTGIFVLWETTIPGTTTVEYGKALPEAEEPNLSRKASVNGERLLHEVQLKDLETATKYMYRVRSMLKDGQELVSPVYTFKTAVQDDDAYAFAFIGDSQYNSRTPWAWPTIAQKIWEDRPHFIVHAGDLVDQGTKKNDWTQHFFPNGHVAMSRFPMYTVLGNHEQDAQHYYDYMVNPAPEYYYTFTYGNAQFFMIDTNRDITEGSEQYNWLEWELAKSTATWKFVVHHHPPYSSEENDHGDTYKGASSYGTHARDLTPLYDEYNVDFCLFGHVHMYERSWPIFKNAVNLKDGVVYINSGGAGGGLEDFDPVRSWFTQELQTGHHYTTFNIFDKTLVFKAIDHEGRLFDTFQMTKEENNTTSMMQPPAPHLEVEHFVFQDETLVKMSALDASHDIYYTLDGSEPSRQSLKYNGPFKISQSAELKVRAFSKEGKASRLIARSFLKMAPLPAQKVKRAEAGLAYKYYEGKWKQLPKFEELEVIRTGVANNISVTSFEHREDRFAVVLEGYVEIGTTGIHKFYLASDDGSRLFIDDQLVIDHDGDHSNQTKYGSLVLEKGKHRIRVEYFEASGSELLSAGTVDPVLGKMPIGPMKLSH